MNRSVPGVSNLRTLHTTTVVLFGIGAIFVDLGISFGPGMALASLIGFSFLAVSVSVRRRFARLLLLQDTGIGAPAENFGRGVTRAQISRIMHETLVQDASGLRAPLTRHIRLRAA